MEFWRVLRLIAVKTAASSAFAALSAIYFAKAASGIKPMEACSLITVLEVLLRSALLKAASLKVPVMENSMTTPRIATPIA